MVLEKRIHKGLYCVQFVAWSL